MKSQRKLTLKNILVLILVRVSKVNNHPRNNSLQLRSEF